MAITVSRQIGIGSRVRYTYYWENFVLVVVLILESKALYFDLIRIVIVIYLRIFCRKWQRWRQVITNHVCQHGGKSWPYWFRKMGNWASLLLSAVLWDLVDRAIHAVIKQLGPVENSVWIYLFLLSFQKILPCLAHILFSFKCYWVTVQLRHQLRVFQSIVSSLLLQVCKKWPARDNFRLHLH